MKKIFLLSVFLLAGTALLCGQEVSSKSYVTIDKLPWANPWLFSGNMSGMVMNETVFNDYSAFADASLSADYEFGKLKNVYDPESNLTGAFNIDSYSKLGKVFLYGRFGYNYTHSTGSRWRGLINPYETPFMMADTIPGNLSLEIYDMEAGIGIPLGRGFAVGVDISYKADIMAKHKDLRNKNTYMDFVISPGVMYEGKNISGGLNLGYSRNTEKIEYKQIDMSSEKYLFSLYGMWLYSSNGFSSAETSRRKENSSYFGSIQLDVNIGKFRLFDSFRADYTYGIQTETGYNNLIHGQINRMTYSNFLVLQYGLNHRIKADISFYTMLGDKYLQREELDPDSNVRVWVSYGSPINCFVRNLSTMDIDYTYRRAFSVTDIRWESSLGFRHLNVDNKYKEAPINFLQDIKIYEGYLRFSKYFRVKRSIIDITPEVSYSWSEGTPNDIINIETDEVLEDNPQWQLLEPLYGEYSFWKASKVSAGLQAKYAYILNPEKGTDIYTKINFNARIGLDSGFHSLYRCLGQLSVGFTF